MAQNYSDPGGTLEKLNNLKPLRVNVSKNQTKIENSWPQSKNRHDSRYYIQSNGTSFLKYAFLLK